MDFKTRRAAQRRVRTPEQRAAFYDALDARLGIGEYAPTSCGDCIRGDGCKLVGYIPVGVICPMHDDGREREETEEWQ